MSLNQNGQNISEVEVTNISSNGFWLLSKGCEMFLSFDDFPWFKKSTIDDIVDVKEITDNHFYWEKLDIDLTKEIIEHPSQFPLVANV